MLNVLDTQTDTYWLQKYSIFVKQNGGGAIKYVNILISSAFWGQKNKKICIKHTQIKMLYQIL